MEVLRTRDHPELEAAAREAFRARWPEFIFHDPVATSTTAQIDERFGEWDVLLVDGGRVVAGGWGVPLRWDGTVGDLPDGYDGALLRALEGGRRDADSFCIMASAVAADADRRGLAGTAVAALCDLATGSGLGRVVCPVRPTWKHRYPLASMARYATWRRSDGAALDPWIRTHERLGATVLGPAERSMVITGTVAEWERWTDMAFPETGRYIVPDALGPVDIDVEADAGTYVEANLWMRHR